MVTSKKIIVVDDGCYQWGADAQELEASLDALGWSLVGSHYYEPDTNQNPDAEKPYTTLCQNVNDAPGYSIYDDIADNDPAITAYLIYRPDRNAWELDRTN